MNEMRKQFNAFHNTRAGTREIGIRVHSKNTFVTNGWKFTPARLLEKLICQFNGLIGSEAAGGNNQNFRRPCGNVSPGKPDGISSLAAQGIHATSHFDHFRHPMAAAVTRVRPFQAKDSRTRLMADKVGRLFQPGVSGCNPFLGFVQPPCHPAQFTEVIEDVFEAMRSEPEDLRFGSQRVQRARDFVA
jgi:hypothetical protein